ncbi:hypothetical protein Plim_1947 [Planctopirus limnophila DSM 3776]|uniref:Uncharacterized protein n=1 Tax=Planctopirus limnophila (strain ATCC 43296 / DSM 3776 / IFAM 1008 / Mu 290) TaxID=521674 RepID=D5SXU0_PLAL2|nr:hypothetical protein [Planctopirus limnophila]ADG67777.1 hypothetical protein Plim_1947 [Planctopirus limnophila DSM 3776]
MGIDYSYEIVAPRKAVIRLVESLASHLVPDDADRLLSAVRKAPERLMAVARRGQYETHDLCLSFLFAPDDRIAEHGGNDRLSDPVSGRVAIGCVWSSLRCGDRFALFRGTAATSGMSHLFESSPNIRAAFTKIGQDAGAWLVAFDDEQDDLLGVWPHARRMGEGVVDELVRDCEYELRVDEYCDAVLRAFGVSAGG